MKLEYFNRSADEQALLIRETAARHGLLPVMGSRMFSADTELFQTN